MAKLTAAKTRQEKAFDVIEAWEKAKYHGAFSDYDSFIASFTRYGSESNGLPLPKKPAPQDVLIAVYEAGSYEGSAFALFYHEGKLYEVHGSHCSCNGLEDCWNPEETTWEALKLRPLDYYYNQYPEACERMEMLLRYFSD